MLAKVLKINFVNKTDCVGGIFCETLPFAYFSKKILVLAERLHYSAIYKIFF